MLVCSLLCPCSLSSQQVGWKVYRAKNLRPMKVHFSECWPLGTGSGLWHCACWVSLKNCLLSASTCACISVVDLHTTLLLLGCETRKLSFISTDPGRKEATGLFSSSDSSALNAFQGKQMDQYLQSIPLVLLPHPSMVVGMVENTPQPVPFGIDWLSISLSMSFLNLMTFSASITPVAEGSCSVTYLFYLF